MDYLKSVQNILLFIIDNWASIVVVIGLGLIVAQKCSNYSKKSNDEKIAIAKQQIEQIMLKFVTDAEEDYFEWVNAGSIKRSQVIDKIYEKYPVLSQVVNQEELVVWLDEAIDKALDSMRAIIEKQLVENETKEVQIEDVGE